MAAHRKIIHLDMDCFYAAVEVRDNPALAGKPVAVGASPTGRGVLTTANYEARKFGVRSAMPTATALRQCPDLILVPVQMDKYRAASQAIHKIFADYTDKIEPLSLDEAFLDVSDCEQCGGSATLIAEEIRQRIYDDQQLTASAGISVNKFIAKVASDWNKPNGQTVITPDQVDQFVAELPVGKIFGVGKVTEAKIHKLGVKTCGDLRPFSERELAQQFGSFGERLYRLCRGIDNRPVKSDRVRKSQSVERTFSQDRADAAALLEKLPDLMDDLERRYQKQKQRYAINGIFVKIKFHDFQTTTMAHSGRYFWDKALLSHEFAQLIEQAWLRGQRAVRLLGIGFQFVELDTAAKQGDLFTDA
ncbi:MAG: DNA polymerase IV [Gammaproteobacteria bacterium]|nr:DNA polymerase IV [Gammaproteobacteria bacterium]